MPSCRHTACDSNGPALACGNKPCDRCDGIAECRHNPCATPSVRPEPRGSGIAVTRSDEIGSLTIYFDTPVPVLTPRAARTLLDILVELTEIPVLDEVHDDR